MRHLWTKALRALGVGACLLATGAGAQAVDPNSDLGQFRDHRAVGMKALDAGDLAMAERRLTAAGAILPDSPSILLLKAQVALQQRRRADARRAIEDYLARGYVIDLGRNAEFNALWDSGLEDLQLTNQSVVGDMFVAATLPGLNLTDAIAYAPASTQIFLSQVRTGKVIALTPAGQREVVKFRPGVAAYGLGLRDGQIWATTAPTRQTQGYDPQLNITSKVVVIDPANGQIVNGFTEGEGRRFGRLLMGRDDLYVTDTERGEILRLNGYQGDLQVLIPQGYMDSPMGMAENEDATVLIVADFISGLYRIDLTQGNMQRLLPPDQGSTLGFSSLSRHGNDLIAIQNGFQPNRVVRLRMSADWSQVEAVETLLRAPDLLSQPTQGVVGGDYFHLVAKSQWDQIEVKDATPVAPAIIGTLKLVP